MIGTLAVMTSGGDSPGMNAAIRAVVRRALDRGISVYGIYYGYEGLVTGGSEIRPLCWEDVGGILQKGGTFLGTARSDHFRTKEGRQKAVFHLLERHIEALVVIGGDGSLMGAHVLCSEWPEHVEEIRKAHPESITSDPVPVLRVIGLPGSIDNDLHGTDMCIGADTAINHIMHAIDDLASTAASHQRTFVVETMGRHCGYLALTAALAGEASWVLVPEEEPELRWHKKMIEAIEKARETGRPHQMVVVAEGARHPDGLRISSEEVKKILTERLGIDVRVTVLGHVQRGGSPTAFDRILATRLGVAAVDTLIDKPDVVHCHMLGLVKNKVSATPLMEVVEKSQAVRLEVENANYAKAQELRGESFRNTLSLVKTLTRIRPSRERSKDGSVVILTDGADAPGMNAAVGVAGRCILNQGLPVLGSRDGFLGLMRGNFMEFDWHELVGWLNRPGSEIGTSRVNLKNDDFASIAHQIEEHHIKGIIAVGGWGTYLNIARLVEQRERFPALNLPIILIPATIDNNLPATEFCIGSDTALNNIIDAVDKIRHTAGATRRAFIVEVMGRQCGFLALMSALASGSEKAYLPEVGIRLAELNSDVDNLKTSFQCGKRMVIYLRSEQSSHHYTTDFIRRLFEEE
ncbi:MAG: 6-phosphofructokinase, partial [Syntrophobacteraceae bacterium]